MPGPAPGADAQGLPLALFVLTRDPTGRLSGRKSVLATAAASIERSGMRVEAVVLSRNAPAATWLGRRLHHVALPGHARIVGSAARVLATGQGSLNESLFDSPRVRRQTAAVAHVRAAQFLVADGLRTAGPSMAAGRPVLVHLDDLLSDRYASPASLQGNPLGFFSEQVPRVLRWPAQRVAGLLLHGEARRADARERAITRGAAVVAMTSRAEADELSRRTGRAVSVLPMAVDARAAGDPAGADPCSFVFLGVLDYAPNMAALQWWQHAVRPALDAAGGNDIRLTVVGHRTGDALPADPRIGYTGYVEDLGAELRRHRAMVVPVRDGAGVKTKVLDGWSVGLPSVTTPNGAAGLTGDDGVLVGDDPGLFARHVLSLRDDADLARRTGAAGRAVLVREWSADALAQRWAAAIAPLRDRREPGSHPPPSRPGGPGA